jgi:hypothetical protein
MKVKATKGFWECYYQLPLNIRQFADKTYELWLQNPRHPSIRFRQRANSNYWTARIGGHYRAVGKFYEGIFVWVWVGSHEQYNHLF